MGKPTPRKKGTSLCRRCGERGHFTKTCEKYGGKKYGRWTVIRAAESYQPDRKAPGTFVLAECECGVVKIQDMGHLLSGKSASCGCSRSKMVSGGDDVPPPEAVMVFGAPMTLGELSALAGRKVEYIWGRMRRGMSAEEAAFGRAALFNPAEPPPSAAAMKSHREDIRAQQAVGELVRWAERWARLREHPRLASVFGAVAASAAIEGPA